ncbi:dephospho-CoA kinase [Schlesneria paludicola]|uniref:dephospho-CoA kinase n=1 Tax=Schlesneria paludicola TaxID=360056 RepID=UPI00029A8BBC|nr:dephospho-CoA kinase [Schlesneria paludicola]
MASASTASATLESQRRIPVVGIVGGIGSGKSAVANWVAERAKLTVLNADALGHLALRAETVKQALCQRFGDSILGSDGEIVRAALAQQVFGNDASHQKARQDLEQIVHPEIHRQIMAGVDAAIVANQDAVLLDAAILLEAGWRTRCDLVVFIDTPDEIRLSRVKENRGWSEEELRRRESSQWSLMEKRRESDLIIANDRDLDHAGQQLLTALEERSIIPRNSYRLTESDRRSSA